MRPLPQEVAIIGIPLSRGARHYVLLLAPRLLTDMDRLGLARIIHCSGLPEQEVTSLYFEFVSVCRHLPPQPDPIPPPLWDYLIHSVRLVSALVGAAEKAELEQAREKAVRKFLPQARSAIQHHYQQQCQDGTVEFRLAALLHHPAEEQSHELCKEALRLEREARFQSCRHLDTRGLGTHQAVIVSVALEYAERAIASSPASFAAVDLVIRLLDLLHSIQTSENPAPEMAPASAERIVLSLGNVLFSEELEGPDAGE